MDGDRKEAAGEKRRRKTGSGRTGIGEEAGIRVVVTEIEMKQNII